jgi:ATP phosphoribosyltransferase
MTARKIRIGLPKGNLNRPDEKANCGHTCRLLELAGFKMKGYEPGREKAMPVADGESDLEFYCIKPRYLPGLLGDAIDLAIVGRDSMFEYFSSTWQTPRWKEFRRTNQTKSRKQLWQDYMESVIKSEFEKRPNRIFWDLEDLGIGKVNVCWGIQGHNVPKGHTQEEVDKIEIDEFLGKSYPKNIPIATAYPHITYGEICRVIDNERIALVENYETKRRLMSQTNLQFWVVHSIASNTELMANLGFDLIVDCVASGESFERNGLFALGKPILDSTAHLYMPRTMYELGRTDTEYKRLTEISDRLRAASHEYARKYPDSIWYPNGKPQDSAQASSP